MAVRSTKPAAASNQQLALEMVKAALLGGAVQGTAITAREVEDNLESLRKMTVQRAQLDAAYIVRLYQGIVTRLDDTPSQA